jgi:CTP:molybdopterin cytidylyltransferase MocA
MVQVDMDSPMISAGIILCAGLSTRMKDFKPLLPMDKGLQSPRTLIECTIDSMVRAGIDHIVLVVGHRGKEIEQVILHRNYPFVTTAYNPRYADSDMMESVRIGISQAVSWSLESIFVLPGDMPKIHPQTYTALLRRMRLHPCKVLIPSYGGEPAHPPLIHAACLDYLLNVFDGPGGLKAALNAFLPETVYLPVDDRGCTLDADCPDDYIQLLHYKE